jgi:prepilin-type N-terminal cleavage/methylation domain-containing protein
MMATLRRAGAGGRDRGLTLVELSVSMMIMGLLAASTMALYLGSMRTAAGTQARLEEINDGRIAVSAMSRSLRTAILPSQLFDASSEETSSFIEATPLSMRFYANINNPDNSVGPSRVTYTVSAEGELVESMQRPNQPVLNNKYVYCDPNSAACAVSRKVLARGLDPTVPIFAYYDALGVPLPGAALTQEQMETIDAVDLSVTVQQHGSGGGGSTYVNRIALPNHDAVIRSEEEE